MLALRQKNPEQSAMMRIASSAAPMIAQLAGSAVGQLLRSARGNALTQIARRNDELMVRPKQQKSGTRRKAKRAPDAVGSPYGTGFRVSSVAAPAVAYGSSITVGPGISNLRCRLAYVAGAAYVGNGTLGATDGVYFLVPAANAWASGYVPIAPADATWGRTYINDIVKHYTRRIYHRIVIHYVPFGGGASSTSALTIGFAPLMGGSGAAVGYLSTNANPPFVVADCLGTSGGMAKPSWEGWSYDLTRYIRGGSGPKQNEFSSVTAANLSSSTAAAELREIIPCNFAFAGNSPAIASYRGTSIGLVYVTLDVELLDFAQQAWAFTPELKRKVERDTTSDPTSLADAIPDEKTSGESNHGVADIRTTAPAGKYESARLMTTTSMLATDEDDSAAAGAGGPPPRSQTPSLRPSVQRSMTGGPLPNPPGPTARVQLSTR